MAFSDKLAVHTLSRQRVLLVFLGLLLVMLTSILSIAQATTSVGLTGVVIDLSGAVVVDAEVEIKNDSRGTTQSAKTDRGGVYRFFFLAPARYALSVSHTGFRTESRRVIVGDPDRWHEFEFAVERQLEDLFRLLPAKVAVEGLAAGLSGQIEAIELTVVSRLFSRVGRANSDLRSELEDNLRQSLRGYLQKGVPVMLREEDFSGSLKADLASALARVGEPEDIAILREVIKADIERVRRGREARAKGDRGRLGNGGTMSYASWHVRAVALLAPDSADTVLLDVLKEPEYEREAAGALVQLARTSIVENQFGQKKDYNKIWEARARGLPPLASMRSGGSAMRTQSGAASKVSLRRARTGQTNDYRLKELAKALAVLDGLGSADLILRALAIPGRFNGCPIVGQRKHQDRGEPPASRLLKRRFCT